MLCDSDRFFRLFNDDVKEKLEYHTVDNMRLEYFKSALAYKKAKSLRIELPSKNDKGEPMLVGCNNIIYQVENYWYQRMQLAERFIDQDWLIRNRIV